MGQDPKTLRQAEREGWATYMPAPILYLTGAIAALGVMLAPLPMYAVVAVIATLGELIRQGRVDLYATVYVNFAAFIVYVVEVWPYILLGTALGLPLALLRRRYGLYYWRVKGSQQQYVWPAGEVSTKRMRTRGRASRSVGSDSVVNDAVYRRGLRLPVFPHVLILWLAGPLLLLAMANYVNPQVYPRLLFNAFAVWLSSGLVARFAWEWLQEALLHLAAVWYGKPRRSLRAEYQLKGLLEDDPALSYFSVWDVLVDTNSSHATVIGNIEGDAPLRRLKELAAFIDGVESVEVREGNGDVQMVATPVISAERSL